ncbi:MAG: hypothetical protein ACLVK0_13780 [Parabacteroides merdae]
MAPRPPVSAHYEIMSLGQIDGGGHEMDMAALPNGYRSFMK